MTRRRFLVALAVVAAVVALAEAAVRALRMDRMRAPIERRLSESLGLEVRLAGGVRLSLLPELHFEAKDVRVANLPGRPSPQLFRAGEVELSLNPWPLLWERRLEIHALRLADVELNLEPDAQGQLAAPPGLASTGAADPAAQELRLSLESLSFDDVRIFYRPGAGETVTDVHIETLELEADDLAAPMKVELRGDVDGSTFEVTGRVGPLQDLFSRARPYPVALRGRVFEAEVELDGTVEVPAKLSGLDLRWSVRFPDFGREARARGYSLPPLGAVSLSGRIGNPNGVLGVRDLALLTEGHDALDLELRGEILDLEAFGGVDLELQLTASDLEMVAPYVDRALPEIDALRLTAHFRDEGGRLAVEGEAHLSAHGGRAELRVFGGHGDLSRVEELDVRFEASAGDTALLAALLEVDPPVVSIGPVTASGRLHHVAGSLALDDISLSLGERASVWAEASGHIDDLMRLRGVEIDARFGAESGRAISEQLGRPIPDIGAFEANALISDVDGSLGISFLLAGGRVDLLRVRAEGNLDDIQQVDEISFQVSIDARDLAVLGALLESDQPKIGPVKFTGRVSGSDEKLVSSGEMRVGETVFAGDWSAAFAPGARPRLTANLYSEHVRVVDTGLSASEEEERPDAPSLFAEGRTLPFASLRDLDARLDFRIDRLTSGTEVEVRDLHVDIRLERGELTIRELSASYETGRVVGGLRIDARESPAGVALFLDATELDLQRLADLIPGNQDAAGSASVWLNLRSSGGSPLRLRENLSGEVSWILEDGTLTSRYAQMFVVNLARVVFPTLPMLSTTESQPVECFRADLTLESGIATLRSLILQGANETVTGSGRIDLAEGRYDLTMLPTTSRPGLLSVAAEVRVTGPLDAPRFKPVKRTIAISAARGLVSNALRPASALFRAFRGGSGAIEDDPCDAPLVRDPESRRPTWLQPPTG